MFRYLNKLIKHNPLSRSLSRICDTKGQVGVVIILIVAVVLVFYAVTLNLGRVAEKRTATTIASNTGASILASEMASYGQNLFMQTLGGRKKFCKSTGLLGAIIGFVIAVVLTIVFPPAGAVAWALTIIGLALSFLALVIQVAIIQPGITAMWNKMMDKTLTMEGRFLEQGIRTALQSGVTDNVMVPDVFDDDLDRVWGFDGAGQPKDKINRFAIYYTSRLRGSKLPALPDIDDFIDNLRDFLYEDTDTTWGLYDPVGCANQCCYDPASNPIVPSQCNPCCVPFEINDIRGGPNTLRIRPPCCDTGDPATECGVSTTCKEHSPFGELNALGDFYQWVYDPYLENYENAFLSFREMIGIDDEHRWYRKDPNAQNWSKQFPVALGQEGFTVDDATGYYHNPPFSLPTPDPREGIYPFLHKLAEWGTDLSALITTDPSNPQCAWCDGAYSPGVICSHFQPVELPQLRLVLDPASLIYDTSPCVLSTTDVVEMPGYIVAADNQCAQEALSDPSIGFWKPGADRYCSEGDASGNPNNWPYDAECPKHKPGSCTDPTGTIATVCECTEPPADPTEFPDDMLDDLVYNTLEFISVAEQILSESKQNLQRNFKDWYELIAEWIEPGPPASPTSDPPCFVCGPEPGHLYEARDMIDEISTRMAQWRDNSYVGASCSDAWCVPPAGCPGISIQEAGTFDHNANGVRGDVEDVIACLDFNVDGFNYGASSLKPRGTREGNDFRFANCRQSCNEATCSRLPRSVIPLTTYNPGAFVAGNSLDDPDIRSMIACHDECNNLNCQSMPLNQSSTGAPYPFPKDPLLFDETTECAANGQPIDSWLTAIRSALIQANPSCDLSPGGWLANTEQSWKEAANQVKKFELRRNFLAGRLKEVNEAVDILEFGDQKLTEFLEQAEELIQARIDFSEISPGGEEEDLPYQAIYGWQTDPPKNDPDRNEGYWHIIKVEARIPKRCDQACGPSQAKSGGNHPWPKVRTYTKKLGTKRCYELVNTEGTVKVRVTKFDENPTSKNMFFPSGQKIWNFRFSNPLRPAPDVGNLEATCKNVMIPDPLGLPPGQKDIYAGAFIMNERIGTSDADPVPGNNYSCWQRVSEILARGGVVDETCAKYFYHEGFRKGMNFKFVPCQAF